MSATVISDPYQDPRSAYTRSGREWTVNVFTPGQGVKYHRFPDEEEAIKFVNRKRKEAQQA